MSRQENNITYIKPSTSIRHDYNSFSKLCHETQSPVVVTKNGEADLVVMSHEAYQKMMAQQRLGQMLIEVDREIARGSSMRNFEDTFSAIKKRLENE
jgi:PHD/YefM family antitoxin component YafN of YafNO toxin-antitoxin module